MRPCCLEDSVVHRSCNNACRTTDLQVVLRERFGQQQQSSNAVGSFVGPAHTHGGSSTPRLTSAAFFYAICVTHVTTDEQKAEHQGRCRTDQSTLLTKLRPRNQASAYLMQTHRPRLDSQTGDGLNPKGPKTQLDASLDADM